MSIKRTAAVLATAALALGLAACSAETPSEPDVPTSTFPEGSINFTVQGGAGGGSDLASRALTAELESILGVSFVVENRTGASGSIAMQYVAEQEPDGYSIGFAPVEIAMLKYLDFDIDPANYDLLGQVMLGPATLAVPATSPYETLGDFIEAATEAPLTVSNSGAGAIWDIATRGLAAESGAELTGVPFDGGAPAVAAAIGNQVDAVMAGAGETKAGHLDGTLRILAIFHSEQIDELPDVPTASDAGYDLEFGGWGGIYAPKGLPEDVKSILEDAISEAANSDSFKETVAGAGNLPVYKNSSDFTKFVQDEFERFGSLMK